MKKVIIILISIRRERSGDWRPDNKMLKVLCKTLVLYINILKPETPNICS